MIKIRHLLILLIAMMHLPCHAQGLYTPFPSTFRNTSDNELQHSAALHPLFQKIRDGRTVRVMQIGDSHVKGNFLPRAIGAKLEEYFNRANLPKAKGSTAHRITFTYYGINGAWAQRFYEPELVQKVVAERPDLVIISFGTNEAHGNFIEQAHDNAHDLLTQRIREACPGTLFLFTTPPGSYVSKRTGSTGRGRRRRYTTVKTRNERTALVARNIVKYCDKNNIAVWDLFTIAGGATHACSNWRDGGLMQADCIHFLAHGYQLQGRLLAEAIIKAYENDAASGSLTRMLQPPTPKEQTPNRTLKCLTSTAHAY